MSIDRKSLTAKILELLEDRGADGLRKVELRRKLGLESGDERRLFRTVMDSLLKQGQISRRHRGRYALGTAGKSVVGRITHNARGFAFVTPDEGGQDIFIPARFAGASITGDTVQVELVPGDDARGPAGRVLAVLDRERKEVTGEYGVDDDGGFVRPLRRDLPERIVLRTPDRSPREHEPEDGDWVTVRITERTSSGAWLGELGDWIGPGTSVDDDLNAIVREFNLPAPYSAEDCARAGSELSPREIERRDLSDLFLLTIDPEDAKDFDDALSVEPAGEGRWRVGVHIADVAAYVAPGSDLDADALVRGFTSYLPGRTLPMLPQPLAGDLCSLREGERRPAHSLFLTVDEVAGEVLAAERFHSWVCVGERLSFAQAEDCIAGVESQARPVTNEATAAALAVLARLASVLRARRAETESFLVLDLPEVRVRCTERPARLVGLEEAKQGRAHHLVEEFMLAANAAVAAELVARGIPGLFRCHAAPGPRDLEEFRALARDLGLKTGDLDSRSGINRFLAGITRDPVARVLGLALLRALPRADYRVAPALHFGLGKECYCHFTSPIRRYADLLVHQQLWAADTGAAVRSHDECETLGETVTGREAETDEAYFAASDRLKLRYLLQQMNDHGIASHEAVVLRVYKQELLLYMVDVGVFARLPARLVSGMGWRVDSLGANGRASAGGMEFRSGSVLYVVPHRVDVVKGDLTVRLAT